MTGLLEVIKSWFFTQPTPPMTSIPTPAPFVALPQPCVDQEIEQCWAAWEQMLRVERLADEATQTLKESKTDREWQKNLQAGCAVICWLTYFSNQNSKAHPLFEYPRRAELEDGLEKFFLSKPDLYQPYPDTRELVFYRLDLGPCEVDPATALRVPILGTQSEILERAKTDRLNYYRTAGSSLKRERPRQSR